MLTKKKACKEIGKVRPTTTPNASCNARPCKEQVTQNPNHVFCLWCGLRAHPRRGHDHAASSDTVSKNYKNVQTTAEHMHSTRKLCSVHKTCSGDQPIGLPKGDRKVGDGGRRRHVDAQLKNEFGNKRGNKPKERHDTTNSSTNLNEGTHVWTPNLTASETTNLTTSTRHSKTQE